jgi:hypothetical protein
MSRVLGSRVQDVGRSHKKKPIRTPDAGVLRREYTRRMRLDLQTLLLDLRTPLPITERERRWKLAIVLAKELGADLEEAPKVQAGKITAIAPAAVDFG